LVAEEAELVADKAQCVCVMGGVECDEDGHVRVSPAPFYVRPDQAANNLFDPVAAADVYSWCVASRVPLRIISRAAVPNVPMRIVRERASKNPHDPVMRYLRNATELGLLELWRNICRGLVQSRDKRWFFLTFCGVSAAEFEQLSVRYSLGEDFPIASRLDGTVKSYDVVTLLLALHDPSDAAQELFRFGDARVELNETVHYFFVNPRHLAQSTAVIAHLHLLYQYVISRSKWSLQARFEQARQMVFAASNSIGLLIRQGHSGWVMCGMSCIVDSRECICSGSFDGTVRLWDVWTGGCVKVVHPVQIKRPQHALPPTTDRLVSAAGAAGKVDEPSWSSRLCSLLRRRAPAAPAPAVPKPTPIASIAKWPSGPGQEAEVFYYGLDDGVVQVWNVHDDGETGVLMLQDENHRHPAQVTALLLVDADRSLLSAGGCESTAEQPAMGADGAAKATDAGGTPRAAATAPAGSQAGSHSTEASHALDLRANEILQWNLKFSIVVARYVGHTKWIRAMVASTDGCSFYSCSNDGTICRWPVVPTSTPISRDAAVIRPDLIIRPQPIADLPIEDPTRNAWIRSIALEDSGLHLFSAGNDLTLRRWDTRTGDLENVYLGHEKKLACVGVPGGDHPLFVFSASNDGFIFQWSIAREVVLARIECRTAITFISLAAVSGSRSRPSAAGGRYYACQSGARTESRRSCLRVGRQRRGLGFGSGWEKMERRRGRCDAVGVARGTNACWARVAIARSLVCTAPAWA
jgi:WD40 repeat protein